MATNPIRKPLRWWERHFQPLLSTSQEKWFKQVTKTHADGMVLVITAFRGDRKTTTAVRVCARNLHPFYKYEYVTSATYAEFVKKEKATVDLQKILEELLYPVITAIIVVAVYVLVKLFYKKAWSEFKQSWSEIVQELASRVTDEIPSAPTFIGGVLTLIALFSLRHFRRRVVIFDDITRMPPPTGFPPRQFIRDHVLKKISGYEMRINVVIVTSTEGLSEVFSDTNKTVRTLLTLPPLESQEFADALARTLGITVKADFINAVVEMYGVEHGLSMRFWSTEVKETTIGEILARGSSIEVPKLDRAALWEVALNLDLQCEPHFALIALGRSPMVNLSSYDKVVPGGVIAAEKLLSRKDVPRRLAFVSLLVSTITEDEKTLYTKYLLALLPKLPENTIPGEGDGFDFVKPLRDKLTPPPPSYWVQLEVDGEPIHVFHVSPAVANIDGLKEAVKTKWDASRPKEPMDIFKTTVFAHDGSKGKWETTDDSTPLVINTKEAAYRVVVAE